MNSCCEPSPEYAAAEAKRKAEEDVMMNTEITLNGVKLRLKDMFPDSWAAKDFYIKLNLLNKSKGGKELLETSPNTIMDDEAEESTEAK